MKILIASLVLISSFSSHAYFQRFWIGHKKAEMSDADFLKGLNTVFFAETVNVGKGKGLMAYQPYVTAMTDKIPAEIALVTYESEKKYKAIRETKEGKAYGERHWDYFVKDISKSFVVEPWKNKMEEGKAYELKPKFKDWQKYMTTVLVYAWPAKKDLTALKKAWSALAKDTNINNSIILITKDWVYEYRSTQGPSKMWPSIGLEAMEQAELMPTSVTVGPLSVTKSQGINAQF